jgi:hypothetical protein
MGALLAHSSSKGCSKLLLSVRLHGLLCRPGASEHCSCLGYESRDCATKARADLKVRFSCCKLLWNACSIGHSIDFVRSQHPSRQRRHLHTGISGTLALVHLHHQTFQTETYANAFQLLIRTVLRVKCAIRCKMRELRQTPEWKLVKLALLIKLLLMMLSIINQVGDCTESCHIVFCRA